MEQAIRAKIRDVLATVAGIGQIHLRERFPATDEEDVALSTVPDPVVGADTPRTNIVQIGIPTVDESEDSGDKHTALTFTYPFTYDLEVVEKWTKEGLEFDNSSDMMIAIYLRARRAFKMTRDLGFNRCVHEYLQQVQVGTVKDEETGGKWHAADWTLTVKVKGCTV
jgi:hypothetical protein